MAERLTEDRQYRLGLAMMAADPASGLAREERVVALHYVTTDTAIPGHWRWRVEGYLDRRQGHGDVPAQDDLSWLEEEG